MRVLSVDLQQQVLDFVEFLAAREGMTQPTELVQKRSIEPENQTPQKCSLTPATEALMLELRTLGYNQPELLIEEVLKLFHSQQLAIHRANGEMTEIDTTAGFVELTEAEIIQENEQRWQTFQQTGHRFSHAQVLDWAASLGIESRG